MRLAGQDSRRGTFSQRFAAIVDRVTNEAWVPLKHLTEDQGTFDVFDSLLSEYAALGFEYGYSVARPDALVLWEAQFGDFVNGAQIISDEFVASGNAKWTQKSGVVLLLPHGFEGQGPDHSSARIEALAPALRRERAGRVPAVDARQLLPPAAPARLRQLPPARGDRHAEVHAAQQAGHLDAGGLHLRRLAPGPRRPHRRGSRRRGTRRPLLRQGPLGPRRPSRQDGPQREGGHRRAGAAVPAAQRGAGGRAAALPARGRTSASCRTSRRTRAAGRSCRRTSPRGVKRHLPDYELRMQLVSREWSSAPSVGSLKVHKAQEEILLDAALG